ncbi:GDP-fucose transporter 1 [Hypsizygus marmoreus]|uniref:GDP-fucose transporter 1 n=1 Tax=Hypsizygus marmoreus TaxID=39966 RepID=A0A369JBR6_HYPMA|nr:GDP-fucose transporter 1 [Hypsizygus marmoreus]
MSKAQDAPQASRLQVAAVISFYMAAALVMVFVNKAVLNSTPDIPISFLFIQLAIAVVLLHVASFLSTWIIPFEIRVPTLELQTAIKLLPYVTVGVAGLIFNTLCLANVDASFFQVARGLLLPFTITISAIATRTRPSKGVILAAFIVTAGFFFGVSPASYFSSATRATSLLPIAYGTLSSLLLALHAVLIKSAHTHVGSDNSVVKLMYYGNLMSAVFLVPFIALNGEMSPMMARWAAGGDQWRTFVVGTAITGVFGFLIGLASLLSIKVTSPVTHMFSSAARSVLQTILGVYIFGDIITMHRGTSILVITLGALFYTWVQSNRRPSDSKEKAIQLPPTPNPDRDMEKGEVGYGKG